MVRRLHRLILASLVVLAARSASAIDIPVGDAEQAGVRFYIPCPLNDDGATCTPSATSGGGGTPAAAEVKGTDGSTLRTFLTDSGGRLYVNVNGTITEASAATVATNTGNAKTDLDLIISELGATNSSAAASDTATADIGGRLQRIAQRLTTLIATDFATSAAQGTGNTSLASIKTNLDTAIADLGATSSTAAASDTATADIGGRLQRIAQRITTLIATDFATSAAQGTGNTSLASIKTDLDSVVSEIGATNSSAAASDTATADVGGRLQRVAQRLTSIIALLPAALDGSGYFKMHEQGTATVSGTVAATQSGTWAIAGIPKCTSTFFITSHLTANTDNQTVTPGCTGACAWVACKNLDTSVLVGVRTASGASGETFLSPDGDSVLIYGNTSCFFDTSHAPADTSATAYATAYGCDD